MKKLLRTWFLVWFTAILIYGICFATGPEDFFYQGNAYFNEGLYDDAIAQYSQAIRLYPPYYQAYGNRGVAYFYKGQYDLAKADFNKALEIDPKYSLAFNGRGMVHFMTGEYDLALSDYNMAIKTQAKNYLAYNNRGLIYLRKHKYQQAADDFTESRKINPNYAQAYSNRGEVYYVNGFIEHALSDFKKLVAIEPNNDYYQINLFLAMRKTSTPNAIQKHVVSLKRYVHEHKTDKWLRTVLNYYLGLGELTEKDVLNEARKGKNPKEVQERLCEAYYYLAQDRLLRGNRAGAEEYFEKSIATKAHAHNEHQNSRAMLVFMKEGKH